MIVSTLFITRIIGAFTFLSLSIICCSPAPIYVVGSTSQHTTSTSPIVEAGLKQNHLCVVGNYKNINDESSMFDEIKPLFVSAVQNNSEEE